MQKRKRKISLTLIERAMRQKRKQIGTKAGKILEGSCCYPSGTKEALEQYGRGFADGFPKEVLRGKKGYRFVVCCNRARWEAQRRAVLMIEPVKMTLGITRLVELNLGFEKDAVVVEAMRGKEEKQNWLERFREMHKAPGMNFVLRRVEGYAKKLGFKWIKVRNPKSLYFFVNSVISSKKMAKIYEIEDGKKRADAHSKEKKAIRLRMETLYNAVADSEGYTRKGDFYVKRL